MGDVFGQGPEAEAELQELLNGSITIPLPTYFTVGDSTLPAKVIEKLEVSEDVCPNLIYLGRKGTFTTSDGVRIISLGGRRVESDGSLTQAIGKFDPAFLDSDTGGLRGAHSAHILLTNQWPAEVARLSGIPVPDDIAAEGGAKSIADLCETLKPWYHFSSTPLAMWEREPFKQPVEYDSLEEAKITRFKSAASITTSNKSWMSAFSIDTSRPPAAEVVTATPFLKGLTASQKATPGR